MELTQNNLQARAGGVMLIIAYLAPLPPSSTAHKNQEPKL